MVISTASVTIPITYTSTVPSMVMVPTIDNSAITVYGIIIAVLLTLLGVFVFISMFLLSKFKMASVA